MTLGRSHRLFLFIWPTGCIPVYNDTYCPDSTTFYTDLWNDLQVQFAEYEALVSQNCSPEATHDDMQLPKFDSHIEGTFVGNPEPLDATETGYGYSEGVTYSFARSTVDEICSTVGSGRKSKHAA